jgi:hypothetical protein
MDNAPSKVIKLRTIRLCDEHWVSLLAGRRSNLIYKRPVIIEIALTPP